MAPSISTIIIASTENRTEISWQPNKAKSYGKASTNFCQRAESFGIIFATTILIPKCFCPFPRKILYAVSYVTPSKNGLIT